MQFFPGKTLFRSRYGVAILAGLAWTGAFPRPEVAGLAWLAPGLLIAAALDTGGAERFRIGYLGGLTHYLSMLYWLLLIPYRWHGLPLGPALGWLALSAVLALLPALWVWLISDYPLRSGESPGQDSSDQRLPPLVRFGSGMVSRSWAGRTLWSLTGATVWVAWEMFLARMLGGFPWDLLGVSQYELVPLIQMAAVTGVYGVSFLVTWVSLSLLSAGLMTFRRPTTRSIWFRELFLPILAVVLLFDLGFRHLRSQEPLPRSIRVALVQPSIPQTLIWDPTQDTNRFRELVKLTEQALTNRADLLIWPESAVPKLLRYDQETFESISNLARRHQIWMIVGADDAEPRAGAANPDAADYYNSSFLINPEGKLLQRYVKRNLVIFGEFIPLEHWLPFLKYFTPIQGGFTPGRHAVQFDLPELGVKTSVLICFEDIFPHLGRSDTEPDTDFLVNITNDGWFDEGAAQRQQAITAIFRAVENGVPLVRCTNNGLTCWIDAQGRLRETLRDARGSIYGAGFMLIEVPLSAAGEGHPLTFYTRHGDWFGWACVVVGCLVLAKRIFRLASRRQR